MGVMMFWFALIKNLYLLITVINIKVLSIMIRTLIIDPGLNTGWAFFDNYIKPKLYGEISAHNLIALSDAFDDLLDRIKPVRMIIEDAEFWSNSFRSRASAGRGNLLKLAGIVYTYKYLCSKRHIKTETISPRKWKGQLPNDVIQDWITEKIDMKFTSEHTMCAVGIGLYKQGII
jgi:hypothetical protein